MYQWHHGRMKGKGLLRRAAGLRLCLLTALVSPLALSAQPGADIVPVYRGMAQYAAAIASDASADRVALWKRFVLDPYWSRCTQNSQFLDLAPPLREPFADAQTLAATAAALRDADIESRVTAAMQSATDLLPGQPTTVCLIAADSAWTYLRDMGGVGGFTPGANTFWVTILPQPGWQDWIRYTVAHEYHHSVWLARHGATDPINNMGDYLVFEGRADAFAAIVDPTRRPAWTHALSAEQEPRAWRTMQRHLQATAPELLTGLMFGGADGMPRWGGYTIGFRIVQTYLKSHAQASIEQWTAIKASELLRQSGYPPADAG